MKKYKIFASKRNRTKVVKPNKTGEDMLNAFEAKLAEFGVEASCNIEAGCESDIEAGCDSEVEATVEPVMGEDMDDQIRADRAVEIFEEDYHDKYKDVGGGFSGTTDSDVYTLGEIKEYWNKANIGDPILEEFSSFDDWWRETRNNYLVEY